ncbi:L-serine dehydratase 2 [Baekduia alba]|uniref:L-serine ammonia-lyase n=1 Tax=Baekduia alba TaxID=2997333 RepID=UPI00233FD999|nr:L-serine ammonia-lyase [Baekduia alba]WCB91508.1 L-serine dehydratase 2 [Baekduia alba]
MLVSAFDLFRVGVGPSSSHTVAPMRAAAEVASRLASAAVARLDVAVYGSLALTARGHGTDRALVAGLAGHLPETVEPVVVRDARVVDGRVQLGDRPVAYALDLRARGGPPGHPNVLRFVATDAAGHRMLDTTFRSIGGGFITEDGVPVKGRAEPALPYATAAELVAYAERCGSVAAVAAANEQRWFPRTDVEARLLATAGAMDDCIERGLRAEGELAGGLRVRRRAGQLRQQLERQVAGSLAGMEWAGLWAMAVNEENAAGGRVVTAPTNGAAGVIPAALRYATTFEGLPASDAPRFLLVAAAIGALVKRNASISGAEVGCQGEVGSAAAMAAAGLAELLGGTPAQVANAAEIALEHHLGMTCDPIGGLVQVPCIERNAFGTVKAITAAKLALRGDGRHVVSLDQAIDAMRRTGADMHDNYKETARGGLAVSVPVC